MTEEAKRIMQNIFASPGVAETRTFTRNFHKTGPPCVFLKINIKISTWNTQERAKHFYIKYRAIPDKR